MGHFEDALFAGISDKLAHEGVKYDIGDEVYVVDAYRRNIPGDLVFEVFRSKRISFCGEERRIYDIIDRKFGTVLHEVPEEKIRLRSTPGRLMQDYTLPYPNPAFKRLEPKKVIFHDPATIIIWVDGTKTVVKCSEGDTYDPEMGFMLCHFKKLLGKSYYKYISKTVKKYKED